MTRPTRLLVAGVGVVALVAASIAIARRNRPDPRDSVAPWVFSADTEWMTIEGIEFPVGMDKADPEILEAYVFAAKHPEVLQHMPCYCGCENPQTAHESNYDCFVDIIDRTGSVPRVSPDPMGFS